MATQALYLKWRPQTFDDMIGQQHVVRTLVNAIRQGRIRHAYLLSGPRGTGKTTTARLLAKAVNCLHEDVAQRPCDECRHCTAISSGRFLDIIEIDAASHTGVDDVRDLRDKIAFAPNEGRYKVYIIDEVHRFSGSAFDALLKTLEEPPAHAIFVLATTEIHKVPETIKSRCLMFEFRRVSLQEVMDRLRMICEYEGISIDDSALELIARQGTGSVRDSISLLDQIVADPNEHVSFEVAQAMLGAAGNEYVWEVVQAIISSDVAYGLDMINTAIDTGADPRQFGLQLIEHLRYLLLIRMGSEHLVNTSGDMRQALAEQAQYINHSALLRAIRAFNTAFNDMKGGWQPQLPLELALVESTKPVDDEPIQPVPPQKRRATPPRPKVRDDVQQQPAQESAETVQDTVAPAAPTMSIADVNKHWEELIKATNISVASILEEWCLPLRVENQVLVIGVRSKGSALKNVLEDAKKTEVLKKAVQQVFGEVMGVRLELVDENSLNNSASSEDNEIINHELLSYAANEFGAEISFQDQETLD